MHLLIFQSQQGMRLNEEAGIEISDMGFPKFRNEGLIFDLSHAQQTSREETGQALT